MKNETTKKIIFIAIAVTVATVLSIVPKDNELLSVRDGQFIGLFARYAYCDYYRGNSRLGGRPDCLRVFGSV